MARKTAQSNKAKSESNAAAESIEDNSDNESKNITENAKPAKRGRKNAAQKDSNQTEENASSTNKVKSKSSKNKKDSGPITKYLQTTLKGNEKTSSDAEDDDEKKVEEVSKGKNKGTKRKRGAKDDEDTAKQTSSDAEEDDEEKVEEVSEGKNKGTKRKRGSKDDEVTAKQSKTAKKEKNESSKKPKNKTSSEFSTIDFSNESKSPAGDPWNLKISSWNINGLRAWLEKDGMSYLHHEKPDILCLQETKCSDSNLPDEMKNVEGYHTYWLSGDKDGYSGVGLLCKEKPMNVEYGIGVSEHDNEGRVITAEFEHFYLVATYVPNAGRKLVRLDYRQKWDEDFRAYLKKLDSGKPVILCGDLNVAHEEIDLANPKTNKKNAGFTKEEREGFSSLLEEGFVDSFRHLYPDATGAYTFWTYMMNARAKNVGWRLDYFVLSERLCEKLCDNVIRKDVFGSDHCPITLFLSL